MAVRIKGLKEKDIRKLQANVDADMSVADFQKLKGKHSDVTRVKKLKTPQQRIKQLEREVVRLKKQLSAVEHQSADAFEKAFNLELRFAALFEQRKDDINAGKERQADHDQS